MCTQSGTIEANTSIIFSLGLVNKKYLAIVHLAINRSQCYLLVFKKIHQQKCYIDILNDTERK